MNVCVYGLGHQGSVVSACLADYGNYILALDCAMTSFDTTTEPGLGTLWNDTRITVSDDPTRVQGMDLIWITYDTPVKDTKADPDWIRDQLEIIRPYVSDNTLILVSSQVPVGFTAKLESDWQQSNPTLRFAYAAENLRHGHAVEDFCHPARVVIGLGEKTLQEPFTKIFAPYTSQIIWVSLDAAEMTKHAINGFLAVSAIYANELSRLCKRLNIDYREIERGMRSEPRIGKQAYVAARGPVEGSLLRDVQYLRTLNDGAYLPLINTLFVSNEVQRAWFTYLS